MSYYERNADRIKARRRQRYHESEKEACQKIVPCEICKTGLTKCAMNKHLKTQKHAANLQKSQNNPTPKTKKTKEDQEIEKILKRVSQEKKERRARGEYVSLFMP